MGVFRVVGFLALLTACDKGKVEPTKGSAQPTPVPLPSPDPAPLPDANAESIDEQLLNGTYPAGPVVWMRVCNDTGKPIEELEYFNKPFTAYRIAKGACTRYEKTTDVAYSYTYAKARIGVDDFVVQPIDYMGETPLTAGLYSYHLKVTDWANHAADIRAKLDSTTTKLEVRTCNDTGHTIKYFEVWSVPFVDVNAVLANHACSAYIEAKHASRVNSASFNVGNDKFIIQPVDGLGAGPLNPGKWSFHLTLLDYAHRSANVVATQD